MPVLIAETRITVENRKSVVAFERPAATNRPDGWDRYLNIDGKPAYRIGNVCGTCAFLFERLDGANRNVTARRVSDELQSGLLNIPDTLLAAVSELLPSGSYQALLMQLSARKVTLGTKDDYFCSEQIELFGKDPFWGLPHYPRIEYYRSLTKPSAEGNSCLYEFVVPMFPDSWLNEERVQFYKELISEGSRPSALAISILDIKQPSGWDEGISIHEHWCLAHYLLDGHHKISAAAELGKPITLLSLLCLEECIAGQEDMGKVLKLLSSIT